MTQHEASRTLVKSAPELWAECSEAASLARHLGQFGEIRITRLEPETAVAWEGEEISGTVRLEPAGWGTKVTLTARRPGPEVSAPAEVAASAEIKAALPEPAPAPAAGPVQVQVQAEAVPEPALAAEAAALEPMPIRMEPTVRPNSKRGALVWLRDFFGFGPAPEPVLAPEPELAPEPVLEPEPELAPEFETEPMAEVPVAAAAEPAAEPVDERGPPADEALSAALDSLGQAHHRPFSRG
jgi:hypothetical protein